MGDLTSHVKDLEEMYSFYCKELGVEEIHAFSFHGEWVEKVYKKEITMTYVEYDTYKHKQDLEQELQSLRAFFSRREAELLQKIAEL